MSARSADVRRLECIPCLQECVEQPFHTEAHHMTLGGLHGKPRLGDDFQIPCCGWHHRGVCLPGFSRDQMTHKYGPSLAHDKLQFIACYGTQEHLHEITQHKLARLEPVSA